MSQYKNFVFKEYEFDEEDKTLRLYYSYDGIVEFSETYTFDFEFTEYDGDILDRAIQTLFFIAGVSYYKAYLAPNIVIDEGQMNKSMADFYSKTYQKGLGEFFYVNKLDPNRLITFPVDQHISGLDKSNQNDSLLIGIGGGKDSLVSVELLRDSGFDITTWSLGHRSQLEPLIKEIGTTHLWVEREWDRSLLEHNAKEAYNGHIPISAIFAAVGTVVAILSGNGDVIVSNENSANEADLVYKGIKINHQYSKSLEFEKDYQDYLKDTINTTRYYSYLRPFSEVYIASLFAKVGFKKYKGVFSSCNRAFTYNSDHMFWCGECAKCAFTFLALTPFIDRNELEEIWGKNLLLDPKLDITYKKLLGIAADKPLDCVGEIKESREAMRLAQKIYPELNKYKFDIPKDYDYKSFSSHAMPENIYKQLTYQIKKLSNT
jgi:hypothetical protein